MLQGLNVRIVTQTEELEPERFNLPLQPLVFPDRETLIRLFPPSDVVAATYWTTAHDYLPELSRRYDFLSVYFIQDYEAYFYSDREIETRRKVSPHSPVVTPAFAQAIETSMMLRFSRAAYA